MDLAEVVGVGLDLDLYRLGGDEMIVEAVALRISDRGFLAVEIEPHLRLGVARARPSGQRVGAERRLALELEQPAAGVGLPRLGGSAIELGNARDGHRGLKWQRLRLESSIVGHALSRRGRLRTRRRRSAPPWPCPPGTDRARR